MAINTSIVSGSFDVEAQNQVVGKWASMVQRQLRSNASRFTYGKSGAIMRPGRTENKLVYSIKGITKKAYGVIDRVTYSFERHGVFVHKGVGRGYKMQGGMVVRTATTPTTNPRTSSEWFNPTLEQSLPELADNLAEINADAVLNATRMMIV